MFKSLLFVPANRPHMFERALASAADAVIFDLEDSVPPAEKSAARQSLAALPAPPDPRRLFVRVNGLGAPGHDEDLQLAASLPVGGLVVPKVEGPADVAAIAAALDRLEGARAHLLTIVAILETPFGILRAAELAATAPARLVGFGLGAEDYRAAMGVEPGEAAAIIDFARTMVANAAVAAHVTGIDTPETEFRDLERLRRETMRARALGLRAKFAIHPAQVPVINELLAPSTADREWAARVIAAYEAATAAGRGAIELDGRMVDAATVLRARAIISRIPK